MRAKPSETLTAEQRDLEDGSCAERLSGAGEGEKAQGSLATHGPGTKASFT